MFRQNGLRYSRFPEEKLIESSALGPVCGLKNWRHHEISFAIIYPIYQSIHRSFHNLPYVCSLCLSIYLFVYRYVFAIVCILCRLIEKNPKGTLLDRCRQASAEHFQLAGREAMGSWQRGAHLIILISFMKRLWFYFCLLQLDLPRVTLIYVLMTRADSNTKPLQNCRCYATMINNWRVVKEGGAMINRGYWRW